MNSSGHSDNKKSYQQWKKRRDIRLRAIPLEVDLENRELFLSDDLKRHFELEFNTSNVDRLITSFVDPIDLQNVQESLQKAREGQEKPIRFHFIHPVTAQRLKMEYRYEIVYVRYASTRLHGMLVNVRESPRLRKP